MKIIAGLGNPTPKYQNTRHNIGFLALDFIVSKLDLTWKDHKKFQAQIAESNDTLFLKPNTFMNNSGQSIQATLAYYKLIPRKLGIFPKKNCDLSQVLTVIHDDLDISLGKMKETNNSRSAGHNGVQSIIKFLKTKKFRRIRVGIKTDFLEKIPTEKFVLGNFSKEEKNILNKILPEIEKLILNYIQQ